MPDTITIEPTGVYTSDQLARMLDASDDTLAAARKAGELRYARKGRRIVYLGEWVLAWLRTDRTTEVRHAG